MPADALDIAIPPDQQSVLVADPDPQTHEVMRGLVDRIGCAVITCVDDASALRHLSAQPHVAIVSSDLPLRGGMQVTLEGARRSPDTHFIVVTRRASMQGAIEAIRNGAFDYLEKPFEDPEAALDRVEVALHRSVGRKKNQILIGRMLEAVEKLQAAQSELEQEQSEGSPTYDLEPIVQLAQGIDMELQALLASLRPASDPAMRRHRDHVHEMAQTVLQVRDEAMRLLEECQPNES